MQSNISLAPDNALSNELNNKLMVQNQEGLTISSVVWVFDSPLRREYLPNVQRYNHSVS